MDMWSLVHTLSGIAAGLIGLLLLLEFWLGFIILLFLAIAWELFEIKIGVGETKQNQIVDVVLALLWYAIVYYLDDGWLSLPGSQLFLLAIVTAVLGVLSFLGWSAMKRRLRIGS